MTWSNDDLVKCRSAWRRLAPVAETGFRHRLTPYKIVEHFSDTNILDLESNNQVANIFLESVTLRLRYRMLSPFSAQSLKVMDMFRTLGSRSLPVTAMLENVDFSG